MKNKNLVNFRKQLFVFKKAGQDKSIDRYRVHVHRTDIKYFY